MGKVVIIFVFEAFPVIDVTKIDNFKQYLYIENVMNQFFCQKIVWNPLRTQIQIRCATALYGPESKIWDHSYSCNFEKYLLGRVF